MMHERFESLQVTDRIHRRAAKVAKKNKIPVKSAHKADDVFAAETVQALWRGHAARKGMRNEISNGRLVESHETQGHAQTEQPKMPLSVDHVVV